MPLAPPHKLHRGLCHPQPGATPRGPLTRPRTPPQVCCSGSRRPAETQSALRPRTGSRDPCTCLFRGNRAQPGLRASRAGQVQPRPPWEKCARDRETPKGDHRVRRRSPHACEQQEARKSGAGEHACEQEASEHLAASLRRHHGPFLCAPGSRGAHVSSAGQILTASASPNEDMWPSTRNTGVDVTNTSTVLQVLPMWRCQELNPGPHACKACALPLSYIPTQTQAL